MADNIRPAGVFDTNYDEDLRLDRTRGDKMRVWGGFILLLLVPVFSVNGIIGGVLPFAIPSVWVSILSSIAIFVIAAQGLNILIGYTG
ncbi:MAG: hypothetical protein AAFR67_02700, partial [Chloroflexota bacterium]